MLTIGLPVYNGAEFLRRSLDRLLSQTYGDFRLIISDNGSTDATAEICSEYLKRDPRISYYRQPETVIWSENFRWVLQQAQTPFFMWATHDDLWEPEFAEENLRALEAAPNAVCSVSQIIYFREDGTEVLAPDTGPLVGSPAERLRSFFSTIDSCGRFYGVYRTEALQKHFQEPLHVYGTDWLLMALTLLEGDHIEVRRVLLRRGAQKFGHYYRRLGTMNGFVPNILDWIWPFRRVQRGLRRRLPSELWSQVKWPVRYVGLRLASHIPEAVMPGLRPIFLPLRRVGAACFHRRWRKGQA